MSRAFNENRLISVLPFQENGRLDSFKTFRWTQNDRVFVYQQKSNDIQLIIVLVFNDYRLIIVLPFQEIGRLDPFKTFKWTHNERETEFLLINRKVRLIQLVVAALGLALSLQMMLLFPNSRPLAASAHSTQWTKYMVFY